MKDSDVILPTGRVKLVAVIQAAGDVVRIKDAVIWPGAVGWGAAGQPRFRVDARTSGVPKPKIEPREGPRIRLGAPASPIPKITSGVSSLPDANSRMRTLSLGFRTVVEIL